MTERLLSYAFSVVLLGAVVSPLFRDPPSDSFPLSNYPMFSQARPNARIVLTNVSGVRRDGTRVVLTPQIAAGNEEVLQAKATIHNAVRGGRRRLASFCDEVAGRAAGRRHLDDVVEIVIATHRFDAIAYFERDRTPERSVVHARCEVAR